jgi:hypothetical protein
VRGLGAFCCVILTGIGTARGGGLCPLSLVNPTSHTTHLTTTTLHPPTTTPKPNDT